MKNLKTFVMIGFLVSGLAWSMESLADSSSSSPQAYTPGLGDIMTLIQQRHSKLYFAAQGGNWDLATFELHELSEGLDDMTTYYPDFKGLDTTALVTKYMAPAEAQLTLSIKNHDLSAFNKYYIGLSQSCTQCHADTNHAFIRIQNPQTAEYTNLSFSSASSSPLN